MIKFLLPVILLLVTLNGFTQKDSVRKYLDAELHFTSKHDAVYAAMAIKNNDHWLLYAVYPDTSVLLKAFFKDAALTVKDGPFSIYYRKGILAEKGYYANNIALGFWESYYANGQIKKKGSVISNHLSGFWQTWFYSGLPESTTNYVYNNSMISGQPAHENSPAINRRGLNDININLPGIKEGAAATWYQNGNKESVVNYHNDSLTGLCTWYRSNGNPSSIEVYTHGTITELTCYDEDGKYSGATCSITKLPVFIHPVFTALDYRENELHKEKRRGIKAYGNAVVKFTVTQKGTVEDLQVVDSPDATLTRLITQVFATMPPWSPAVTHNRKINYPLTLVIPYYED